MGQVPSAHLHQPHSALPNRREAAGCQCAMQRAQGFQEVSQDHLCWKRTQTLKDHGRAKYHKELSQSCGPGNLLGTPEPRPMRSNPTPTWLNSDTRGFPRSDSKVPPNSKRKWPRSLFRPCAGPTLEGTLGTRMGPGRTGMAPTSDLDGYETL